MNRSRDAGRRGVVLLMAVVLILVLSDIVAFTALTVSSAARTSRQFSKRSAVRRSLDSGLAEASLRVDRVAGAVGELTADYEGIACRAAWKPADNGRYLVRVEARPVGKVPGGWREVEIESVDTATAASGWRVLSFREGLLMSPSVP